MNAYVADGCVIVAAMFIMYKVYMYAFLNWHNGEEEKKTLLLLAIYKQKGNISECL